MSKTEYTLSVKSCLQAHTEKAKQKRDKVPGRIEMYVQVMGVNE